MSIKNLKSETIEFLARNGKTIDDIRFISLHGDGLDVDEFLKLADREYNAGYGHNYVDLSLVIAGDDWWMERREYDGAEGWFFMTKPVCPAFYHDTPQEIWTDNNTRLDRAG